MTGELKAIKPVLDRYALGRALTELASASAHDMLARARGPAFAQVARRVGLTGAPGAGKSTLAGHLALYRMQGQRMGVLAVDPSSPKSGGAILGDRIRMDDLAGSPELYIRSLGSRSASDGLSDNLPEMLDLMDSHGFDEVLLETVGVGQAEYAARAQVDTLLLVLLPESGDVVQAMKAGIMEMADIFVVNKCDLPGARKMATDIQRIVSMARRGEDAWRPRVLLASASQPDTVTELSQVIDEHQAWLAQSPRRALLQAERARYRLRRLVERLSVHAIAALDPSHFESPMSQQLTYVIEALQSSVSTTQENIR